MSDPVNAVFVLPNGEEVSKEVRVFHGKVSESDYRQAAERVVSQAGLTTSRQNPQAVKVKVYRLTITGGKLARNFLFAIDVIPPCKAMTEEEYKTEMSDLLDQLPQSFHGYVESAAYDEGHSAGYAEVIICAHNIICNLKPAIEHYRKSLFG